MTLCEFILFVVISGESLMHQLMWLNDCLANQEAATWATFHKKLSEWCDSSTLFGSRQNRSLVAFEVMTMLVNSNKPAFNLQVSQTESIIIIP